MGLRPRIGYADSGRGEPYAARHRRARSGGCRENGIGMRDILTGGDSIGIR